MFYIWQMNDGRWHISPLGGRPSNEMTGDSMSLYNAGLDRGFETKREATDALKAWQDRQPWPGEFAYPAGVTLQV